MTEIPKKGGQAGSVTFDDTTMNVGVGGHYSRLSPELEVGETLYHREITGTNYRGEPIGLVSTADVAGFDGQSMMLSMGAQLRYNRESVTQYTNDPSVKSWLRERPSELPADELSTKIVDPEWATAVPEPRTPEELTWLQLSGEGARTEVNSFLNGDFDGAVDHARGGVQSHLALFKAVYAGTTLSVLVLGPPYNYQQNGEGIVTLRRLANRPEAPANTSSWMIARAREWARSRGYNRMETYAGIGGNDGTCYEAAGLKFVGTETVSSDDEGWANRPNRGVVRNEQWERRKYVASL